MMTDEATLEVLARDGSMNYADWPLLLGRLLSRLDKIVHNDFPAITLQSSPPTSINRRTSTQEALLSQGTVLSQDNLSDSQKENATPQSPPKSPLHRPSVPLFSASSPSLPPNDKAPAITTTNPGSLPPPLSAQLVSIKDTLRNNFSQSPPHTIQRLAELLLYPRKHYRNLPSYIRALDRVVSVSSGADIFPLPTATHPNAADGTNNLINGTGTIIGGGGSAGGLGSDESLGGALLTPIPWLQNSPSLGQGEVKTESTMMVDGPNGAGSIETVSISLNRGLSGTPQSDAGGISKGELLRQEQKAGVVPVSQIARKSAASGQSRASGSACAEEEETEEQPHARGPDEVGMSDLGLQKGAKGRFDVEAALGRSVLHIDETEDKDFE